MHIYSHLRKITIGKFFKGINFMYIYAYINRLK